MEITKKLVTIRKVFENSIEFDDGSVLKSIHYTECCEEHKLYFQDATKDLYRKQIFIDKEGNFFERIEDCGIRLKILNDHPVFIPGYGANNGEYSCDIILQYKSPKDKINWEWDITECQDIEWY